MKILVLGATSMIAEELVRQLAKPGDTFLLGARDPKRLEIVASDLWTRLDITVHTRPLDALATDTHAAWIQEAIATLGGLDGVLLCFGYLGEGEAATREWAEVHRIIDTNFTAAVSLLEPAARHLEAQKSGYILALSSVAGVRGRRSNYQYGAAKAGLTIFLEGLAHRLAPSGVKVKIAKLGFVDTPMTAGLPMAPALRGTPERAARSLIRLLHSPVQSAYVPWFWRPILSLVRSLPSFVFNRTKL